MGKEYPMGKMGRVRKAAAGGLRGLLWLAVAVACAVARTATAGDIHVQTANVRNEDGFIKFVLYDSPHLFAKYDGGIRSVLLPTERAMPEGARFFNLPEGFYAIVVFHDEDADDVFGQTLLGKPLEGYGFSLNIVKSFFRPDFRQTQFYLAKNAKLNLSIILRYP